VNVNLIWTPFVVKFTGTRSCKLAVDQFDGKFTGTRSCKLAIDQLTGNSQECVPANMQLTNLTGNLQERVPANMQSTNCTGNSKKIHHKCLNTFFSLFLSGSLLTEKMLLFRSINLKIIKMSWPTLQCCNVKFLEGLFLILHCCMILSFF
jgi:hypothetical protein